MHLQRTALICGFLFATAGSANSAPDKDEALMEGLTAFGLRGIWAPDCYKPISPDNPRISINLTVPGTPEIMTRRSNASYDFETMFIQDVEPTFPDMLTLKLTSMTLAADVSYDRTDTYQAFGKRLRLMRSEITEASGRAANSGFNVGLHVENGLSPAIRNAASYLFSPLLEQCKE